MIAFGWRPNISCYEDFTKKVAKREACSSPNWWYVLLGLAVVGGLAGRQK